MDLSRRPVSNSSRLAAAAECCELRSELGCLSEVRRFRGVRSVPALRLDTMWRVMALWGLLAALAASAQVVERDLFSIPGISTNAPNDSCANVDCQKGTCVPNNSSIITDLIFPYKCVCDSGWSTLESLIPLLAIPSLPCNIPNCTLNLNCSGGAPAPAPVPAPAPSSAAANANSSACLVPGICGNGKCEIVQNGTLVSSFKCVCDPGYANILNMTAGYCANQCEIGGNCQNLGITLGGQSPSPPPAGGASANSTSTSPNAGTPSSSPKTLGIPVSSPEISPVSGLGAPSASFSPGWRHTPLSHGFYTSAGLMMLGSFFLAQQ